MAFGFHGHIFPPQLLKCEPFGQFHGLFFLITRFFSPQDFLGCILEILLHQFGLPKTCAHYNGAPRIS